VIIWIVRQRPSKEPKFQNEDRFLGAGKSIKEPDKILAIGSVCRNGLNILRKRQMAIQVRQT